MGRYNVALAFLAGTVLGGATVWYMTKERYAQLAEEEINSVKAAYAKRERAKEKSDEAMRRYKGEDMGTPDPAAEGPKATPAVSTKIVEKGSISEYAQRIQNGAPMEYSRTTAAPKPAAPEDSAQSGVSSSIPYTISPDEFKELDGYTAVSLTYFADGVLADENGIIIDDVEEMVGDALSRFGEYEEDAVYVRNDAKRCDYEVLLDEREYAEFRSTLPTNL